MTGTIALVGSGEYLPIMRPLEAELLHGRSPRYVQIATAAVPDGAERVAYWHDLGAQQARALGVEPIIATVANAEEANSDDVVSLIDGAGLIYLSGGHPTFVTNTLRDTALWDAIVRAWRSGSSLAGCSAGAMALTQWVPSLRHPREGDVPGLGLVPHLRVIPHFDAFFARMPQIVDRFLQNREEEVTLVGIDENTALITHDTGWEVRGEGSVWILTGRDRQEFRAGESVPLAPVP